MKFKTEQAAFNYVVRGLKKQGYKQAVNEESTCVLRTKKGLRCAVGQFITKAKYRPALEDYANQISLVMAPLMRAGVPKFEVLIKELRNAHDSGGTPARMRAWLRAVARDLGLTQEAFR